MLPKIFSCLVSKIIDVRNQASVVQLSLKNCDDILASKPLCA